MHTTQNLLLENTTTTKTPQIKNQIQTEEHSINDNQSSVIIDELSENYSDGLDGDEEIIEVNLKNYDQEEEQTPGVAPQDHLAVSKSHFYKTDDAQIDDGEQETKK